MNNVNFLLNAVERTFLDPRVEGSLGLAKANIQTVMERYKELDVYTEILEETIEDLDKVLFFIKQLREGLLK